MSKRFGRNQKRKLREALVEKEKECNEHKLNGDHYKRMFDSNNHYIKRCYEILGEYFFGLSAKETYQNGHDYLQDFRIANRMEISLNPVSPMNYYSCVSYQCLEKMIFDVEMNNEHREHFGAMKHVRIVLDTSRGKRFAYCVSEESMRNIPREFLIDDISSNFSEMLVSEFKNKC